MSSITAQELTALASAVMGAVRGRHEKDRFRELAQAHGSQLDRVSGSYAESAVRSTATRCAAREDALLRKLGTLIIQAAAVAEHTTSAGPRLGVTTDELTATADAIARLAHGIQADRSQLSVLRSILTNDQPTEPVTLARD